jgi:cell division transport system permease protein
VFLFISGWGIRSNALPLSYMKYPSSKKLGSYPTVGVLLSISLALFVIGLFGMLMIYSHELERVVRENVKMQVYLKTTLTETQRLQVENKLLSMNFVNRNSSSEGIEFVSKEDAAKKFIEETGEDFTKFIGDNPLKDAYLVTIDPAYQSKPKMEQIKKELESTGGVFQVFYVEGLIESINQNIRKAGLVLAGLAILLILIVVLLINNTMRIALFSQRFLIRSMQLIGARQWFIQRPFLLRAGFLGLMAAILSIIGLYSIIRYAQRQIEDLILLHNPQQFLWLAGVLIITGLFMAVFSSYFSIRKYLRMSLDELF